MPRATSPARLGRAINFGDVLDVPAGRNDLGFRLRERHVDEVKAAGFDTIRLPVRWSAYAQWSYPFAIASEFFARVDRALERELNVVVNVHHYHELNAAPGAHTARFVALWRQIAWHFAERSDRLGFEPLNEPRAAMTADRWNALAQAAARRTAGPLTLPAQRGGEHPQLPQIGCFTGTASSWAGVLTSSGTYFPVRKTHATFLTGKQLGWRTQP